MTIKREIETGRILLFELCILVFLIAGTMNGLGQGVSSDQSKSAAQAYCVQMGYLYQVTPSLNNGQPICRFTNTAWCDATAYYAGQCSASNNPFGLPNPYVTYYSDGSLQSSIVHTPYGDVPIGAVYANGDIPVPTPYGLGYEGSEQAAWMYGAISFLNAP